MKRSMVWLMVLGMFTARAQSLSEDFSGPDFPPEGWTRFNSAGGNFWDITASGFRSAPTSAFVFAYSEHQATAVEDDWLVTPVFNFSGIASCTLTFWDDEKYTWLSGSGYKYLKVATTGGPLPPANYRPVWTSIAGEDRDWAVPVVVSLDEFSGEDSVWVAWHFVIDLLRYGGYEWYIDDVAVESGVAVVDRPGMGGQALPVLAQNAPNPFTRSTDFGYQLPSSSRISLAVYDLVGRPVRTLVDGIRPAGNHSVRWDGRDDAGIFLPAGVYFARLVAGQDAATQRPVLLVR